MWTNEQLEHMREVTDPLADSVVAKIIESGGLETFDALMRHLVNNRDIIPDSLPAEAREFFEKTQVLPAWAMPAQIKRGEEVFALHGPEMVAMLFFVSLPSAYSMAKGAHVLAITAELTMRVHRRIFRTAQFITDVLQPGGLSPNGRGVRSAQKVRLIHAALRHYIKYHPKRIREWNLEWGEPINQEDMASTLLDFSVGVMKGVKKIGIKLTPDQAEAYHHCWRVVGHILGLRPELQAVNVREAFELAETISTRQLGTGVAGETLTKDLIQFLQGYMPFFLRGFPATAIRYLSGDRVANAIKCGRYNWTVLFLFSQIAVLRILNQFRENHPGLKKYIRSLNWNLMHKVVLHEEGSQFYFEIPDGLRSAWHLPAGNG